VSIQFPQPPRRILIVKPSAIGDVVHTLPVLNLLRRKYPAAHIAWVVTPACSGILEGHPQLNDVILFHRNAGLTGLRALAKRLKSEKFDLVLDLQGLFRSGLFCWATKAPRKVGFANARELSPLFYTHKVPVPNVEVHAMDRYLDLAEAVGCDRGPVEYVWPTDDADRAAVKAMVGERRYAVLLPGTNWATKRWPVEKFAAMVEPLRQRFGLDSVIAGRGDDTAALAPLAPAALNLEGKTNLRQLVALLEGAAVVFANDSGPMHIAAALGRPLVTLFGPTNPVRTGPFQRMDSVVRLEIVCSPCYSRRCSHHSCMKWLEIEPVLEEVQRQVSKVARATSP
jgi:lipopolysaccharide heptosyltransferase I